MCAMGMYTAVAQKVAVQQMENFTKRQKQKTHLATLDLFWQWFQMETESGGHLSIAYMEVMIFV
jgi:hypothetical protein